MKKDGIFERTAMQVEARQPGTMAMAHGMVQKPGDNAAPRPELTEKDRAVAEAASQARFEIGLDNC